MGQYYIEAVGDYGHIIKFGDVQTAEEDFSWESYEPKQVPPIKLAPSEIVT